MRSKILYLKFILIVYAHFTLTLNKKGNIVYANRFQSLPRRIYENIRKLHSLPFEDCGSLYDISFLNISSCATLPCEMKRGSTVLVNVIFDDSGNDTKFLKHRVRWILNAVKTNALITPDPCDGSDDCITKIDDGKSYWAELYVSNFLLVVRGTMMWEAVDEYNQEVICFKVPVVITV